MQQAEVSRWLSHSKQECLVSCQRTSRSVPSAVTQQAGVSRWLSYSKQDCPVGCHTASRGVTSAVTQQAGVSCQLSHNKYEYPINYTLHLSMDHLKFQILWLRAFKGIDPSFLLAVSEVINSSTILRKVFIIDVLRSFKANYTIQSLHRIRKDYERDEGRNPVYTRRLTPKKINSIGPFSN
ncbi:hypothetical protein CHS0354_037882 [Potamilus streckersoni]|uniref:Uncharacterized protein n=1 Tax=Potamilus streckersoni TaxID=2493646 RepID=A0AAE0TAC7_9BIVA|nr:hypothetical protein CHS0354_037882 [Potamilus streckersoni]